MLVTFVEQHFPKRNHPSTSVDVERSRQGLLLNVAKDYTTLDWFTGEDRIIRSIYEQSKHHIRITAHPL